MQDRGDLHSCPRTATPSDTQLRVALVPVRRAKVQRRCQLYRSCFGADVIRLARQHGHAPVQEALEIVKQQDRRGERDLWDQKQHAAAVRAAISRFHTRRAWRG
jgi:hypothetical protein